MYHEFNHILCFPYNWPLYRGYPELARPRTKVDHATCGVSIRSDAKSAVDTFDSCLRMIFIRMIARRRCGMKGETYFRAWRRKQVSWHRSERVSGASVRRRSQRGPSASSRAVGEPRRLVEILVPPIAPAGTLLRPWNKRKWIC